MLNRNNLLIELAVLALTNLVHPAGVKAFCAEYLVLLIDERRAAGSQRCATEERTVKK